jgi:hypothetical protein
MADNHRARDFSNWALSDTEVLGVVDDLADENGWTHTIDVRMQFGENPEEVSHSGAGGRIAWCRRYGWLEQHPDEKQRHRLTAMGHEILDNPKLARPIENALEKMNPAQRLALTRELSESGAHSPEEIHTALRRQWARSIRR